MAVKRSGKVFAKSPIRQTTQTKKKTSTRRAKVEAEQIEGLHENQEPLGERGRQEMMVQWAINGFKPNGPKGFAPTEGTSREFKVQLG